MRKEKYWEKINIEKREILRKEKYWENRNIGKDYGLRKVNIDTINWEKLFDGSDDHK